MGSTLMLDKSIHAARLCVAMRARGHGGSPLTPKPFRKIATSLSSDFTL